MTGGPPQYRRRYHPPAFQTPPQNPAKDFKSEPSPTISSAPSGLQECDPTTFFYILDRIDQTPLEDAIVGPVAGPGRRGPKLRELERKHPVVPLVPHVRQEVRTYDPPTPTGLHRELEDPKSDLAKLCGFVEGKGLLNRSTVLNHFRRIERHTDFVAAMCCLEINQICPACGP